MSASASRHGPIDTVNQGVVFTRRWVAEFILDTCGYTADVDLCGKLAVEPACGEGAFLLPMVRRLSHSLRRYGRSLAEATKSIRAYDVQPQHVEACRNLLAQFLTQDGWSHSEVARVVREWVIQADYLLSKHEQEAHWVIGNPPYVRAKAIPADTRALYMASCRTMTAGADIYVGFIEKALRSLRPGGVVAFIVADRWMHNKYGRELRKLVASAFSIEAIYELHGVDAFAREVSAYPAIVLVRRGRQGPVLYASTRPSFGPRAAELLLRWSRQPWSSCIHDTDFTACILPKWFESPEPWPSATPDQLALLQNLNERFRPLEDPMTGTRIGIGVATGADDVYIVNDKQGIEPDRLLPLVMTSHIRTGKLEWQRTWLVNPWTEEGGLVRLEDYPGLAAYLNQHRERLMARHVARKSPSESWFRTIDKVNASLKNQPKLLFQDLKARIDPVLDEGNYYPHHNIYWLTSKTWDLRVLGGLLLSAIAEMFVAAYCVKMRGGTLRFQAQYLRLIRVPDPKSISEKIEKMLVRAFETRDTALATEAAIQAYGVDASYDSVVQQ